MTNSPIALFVYNRPSHTKRMLDSLRQCKGVGESKIYVFVDGPRENAHESDLKSSEEVKSLVSQIDFGCELELEIAKSNKGLANSIEYGVTKVLTQHDRIIVVEDDLILGKEFLNFMNEALSKFSSEEKIMHVSAYMPKLKGEFSDVALISLTHSWGWGTWKRAWQHFNSDAHDLMKQIKKKNLVNRFNYEGSFRYYKMLERTLKGTRDSWAIKWYASVFLIEGLALNSSRSLIKNIGHDSSGTHSFKTSSFDSEIHNERIEIDVQNLREHLGVRKAMRNFYIRQKFTDGPSYYWQMLKAKFKM